MHWPDETHYKEGATESASQGQRQEGVGNQERQSILKLSIFEQGQTIERCQDIGLLQWYLIVRPAFVSLLAKTNQHFRFASNRVIALAVFVTKALSGRLRERPLWAALCGQR